MDAVSRGSTDGTCSRTRDSFAREAQACVLPLKWEQPETAKVRKKRREWQEDTLSGKQRQKDLYSLILSHPRCFWSKCSPPNQSENRVIRLRNNRFIEQTTNTTDDYPVVSI